MKSSFCAGAAAATVALLAAPAFAQSRDQIQIAGSSTVLPYASIVAEAFGENFDFPTPVVASGGSSAGLQQFCEGVGLDTIDIANSSRPIRDSEVETCAANGVDRHHRGQDRLRRHRLRLEDRRPGLHRLHPRPVVPGAGRRGGQGRRARRQPGQDLGRGRPEPARRPDPRLRPGHQARHPRGLRGEGDPAGLRGLRRARGHRSRSTAATRTRRTTPA